MSAAAGPLVAILRLAYSGELAAAWAYRGHWRSVSDPGEREHIRAIEEEERAHRARVGAMLAELGAEPSRFREAMMGTLGRVLGALCHVSGWLAPMYGAGRLESRNVHEYEVAARRALAGGRTEWVDELLEMAEREWDHEAWFRERVRAHWLGKRLPLWKVPPPRESIRESFAREAARLAPEP